MKNKFIIFLVIILNNTSCRKNYLDVAPLDKLSSSTFWRDSADADKAATGVYSVWASSHTYQLYFADDWSDDAIPTGFWHFFYYYAWGIGNISPTNGDLNNYWAALYSVVRNSNTFLANVDRCVMSETYRNTLKGEVRFIRAFEYQLLNYTWGEVPIVNQPLNVDALKVPRPAAGTTVDFILRDLDSAIAVLPVVPAQTGRISKGAALALKARVLLYEGRFTEAADAANAVMGLGNYQLLRTAAGDGYHQLFNTKQSNNAEEILGWQNDGVNRNNDQVQYMNFFNNTLVSPANALVSAYEAYDPVTDKSISVDSSTIASTFTNRDPRLNFTIAHTGSVINGITLNSDSLPLSNQSTGYGAAKFITDEVIANSPHFTTDYILIRYAEVLLTYAEAKIEANEIDASVLSAINDIRSRAYGTTQSDLAHYPEITSTDQATLRAVIRNERRVELALEGFRWFDLKRWQLAAGPGGTMNGTVWGALLGDGTHKNAGTRALTDPNRDYLRPIPQPQIDLEGKAILAQNPGY